MLVKHAPQLKRMYRARHRDVGLPASAGNWTSVQKAGGPASRLELTYKIGNVAHRCCIGYSERLCDEFVIVWTIKCI